MVRQALGSEPRLTFEEFAILCRLSLSPEPLKTSDIASYQGALRPTMTHRTNHLAKLGLIRREGGTSDKRNVVCAVSEEGRRYTRRLCVATREAIPAGRPLSRTSPDRICKYVDAMGSVYCTAGDLILLALREEESHQCTVMDLVERLGLLQPTVSMSIGSLGKAGKISRELVRGSVRSASIGLTESGTRDADRLAERIGSIVVRRRPRRRQESAPFEADAASEAADMEASDQVVPPRE